MGEHESLLPRIRELEHELSCLWRRLVKAADQLPEQPLTALEVTVGEHRCLIAVDPIREVLPMLWPTPIPDAPAWLMGTFEYSGTMVPLIDLGCRLDGTASGLSIDAKLIVCDSPVWAGLVVDTVEDVISFDARELSSPHPDIPISPAVVGSLSRGGGKATHLLSITELLGEMPASSSA